MDIRMQCCGIILLLVLLVFYIQQKKMFLYTEWAFLRSFLVTLACVILDILSIVVLEHRAVLPELFVQFICKTYLVTLVGEALCGLLYIYVDIYSKRKTYWKRVRKCLLWGLAGMLLIYILPMSYHFAEDGETVRYTEGPSVYMTYLCALVFLVANICLIHKKKSIINPKRREAMQLWMILWIGAAVVQLFNSSLLLVGYMSSIGIMVLYLKLENPEANMDKRSGMFNHNALMQYMTQLFGREKQAAVLVIALQDALYEKTGLGRREEVHMEMVEFLLGIKSASVFKDTEDEVFLMFENVETAKTYVERISQRFRAGWGNGGEFYIKHCLIYMPDFRLVNSPEELLYLIHHIHRSGSETFEGNLIYADKAHVEEMYRQREMEKLLESAIENDRVEVYYQPIFSTKENSFTSAEALVRVRDENGNIIPPGVFIGIAEQNGMILRLGKIVFEKVCGMMKRRDITQYGLHYLEINLSVVQCAHEQLAEDYIQIMKTHHIPPEQVNLEITESASLEEKMVLLKNMKQLLDFGVHFSLDDFGTGQSNLNYIVDMPVDIVKFDQEMTTAYFENKKAKYVMDSAINMIHGMGLEIVSEGIETKEQYLVMREMGVSYIQGYYFSKPLPEDEFWDFICGHANAGGYSL